MNYEEAKEKLRLKETKEYAEEIIKKSSSTSYRIVITPSSEKGLYRFFVKMDELGEAPDPRNISENNDFMVYVILYKGNSRYTFIAVP